MPGGIQEHDRNVSWYLQRMQGYIKTFRRIFEEYSILSRERGRRTGRYKYDVSAGSFFLLS